MTSSLGRAALDRLRRRALARPGAAVSLNVLAHDQRGIEFWRAVGFTDYGIRVRTPGRRA